MSINFPLLFTNDSGSAGGPNDFVKAAFNDITIPPNSNTGLTSTALTNPLGDFFANDNLPKYGSKTLWIKDLVLIDDHSKWIQNRPTYRVRFQDNFYPISAYVFGNPQFEQELSDAKIPMTSGQKILNLRNVGDGFGVSGRVRRCAFILQPTQAATPSGTAQIVVDGVNTTTLTAELSGGNADNTAVAAFNPMVHAAAQETNDLHDLRITTIASGQLRVVGVIVYFENAGANVELSTGTTYVDKSKIQTATSASMALSTYGSSLGGVATYYMSASSGYAVSAQSASTPISIAQGSSGTNLLAVTTGTGASFPAGSGIVVAQGTSMYVGSVLSVSTDTLTVSPTLPFGITSSIYRSWFSSPTYAINASLFQLSSVIDFSNYANLSRPILDLANRFNVWGSNIGLTQAFGGAGAPLNGVAIANFLGASGFLQVEGYFSAAEIETYTNGAILNATLSINGTPGWSVNVAQTGMIRRTVLSEAGPGWNSFVVGAGSSMATGMGISRIYLYQRAPDLGVTFGQLAQLETAQAYTERTATNATLMALGNHQRVYSDQLYLQGPWVRSVTTSAAGGVIWSGSTTTCSLKMQYYGKNFGVLGSAGGGTLSIDGVGAPLTFNAMQTVASEGFHTLQYVPGTTTQIQAIDFNRSTSSLKYLANVQSAVEKRLTQPNVSSVELTTGNGYGSSNTKFRRFSVSTVQGTALSYADSSTLGMLVTVLESGWYGITYVDTTSSAGGANFGVTKNSTQGTTSIELSTAANLVAISFAGGAGFKTPCPAFAYFNQGDQIRCHSDGGVDGSTAVNSRFSIVKMGF